MTDNRTLRERLEEVEIDGALEGVVVACVTEWLTAKRKLMWEKQQPENRGKFQIDWEYSELLGELSSVGNKDSSNNEVTKQ